MIDIVRRRNLRRQHGIPPVCSSVTQRPLLSVGTERLTKKPRPSERVSVYKAATVDDPPPARGQTTSEVRKVDNKELTDTQHSRRPRLAEAAETSAAPQVTATAKRLFQILQSDFQDARSQPTFALLL